MTNARTARAWIVAALGEGAVADHFAAVSTRLDKVAEFGVEATRVFGFWDWVGGRYSIWSSIGLPLAIAIGPEHYLEFLSGGAEVDAHFREAPPERNIPLLMGLVSVWNRNVLGYASQAVIPYDQRLARFPAYLQQLQMESNGKSVRRDGSAGRARDRADRLGRARHQRPARVLPAAAPGHGDRAARLPRRRQPDRRRRASPRPAGRQLLRPGRGADARPHARRSRGDHRQQGASAAEAARLAPHKTFSGSRPSSTLLYAQLDPRTLGRLVALYEHKVFVEAAVWDINPFDQWGVELGKELASRLAPIVADANADLSALDPSTAGLIAHMRALRG